MDDIEHILFTCSEGELNHLIEKYQTHRDSCETSKEKHIIECILNRIDKVKLEKNL